jgi:hypothetical protein
MKLADSRGEWDGPIQYVGRPEAASPAEGSMVQHVAEQSRILAQALDHPPAVHVELPAVSQVENGKIEVESWGLGSQKRY